MDPLVWKLLTKVSSFALARVMFVVSRLSFHGSLQLCSPCLPPTSPFSNLRATVLEAPCQLLFSVCEQKLENQIERMVACVFGQETG